jgi:hypothetical protein
VTVPAPSVDWAIAACPRNALHVLIDRGVVWRLRPVAGDGACRKREAGEDDEANRDRSPHTTKYAAGRRMLTSHTKVAKGGGRQQSPSSRVWRAEMPSSSGDVYREATQQAGAAAALDQLVGVARRLGPAMGTVVLPFALVLYLALQNGGYDEVVRSEIGVAVWWVVLLGALVGLLPVSRFGRAGWVGVALLAAFAAWTAVGISWSESSERSVEEVARLATYLGVFALALAVQGRYGLHRTLASVAAAIGVIGVLALLSRLHPAWFPADNVVRFLPDSEGRLSYPLNYWNGVAALMAVGIPLLLTVATQSRRLLSQALATAALPIVALAAFYTFSRGGAVEIAVGLLALLLLHPRRLALLPTLGLAVAGSALVIAAASQRDALEDGLRGAAAQSQGDEMIAVVLVVCAGVALVRVAFGLVARHGIGPRPQVSRRAATTGLAIAAVAAVAAGLVAGVPSELSDRWEEFKDPRGAGVGIERFDSASGAGRYQQYQAAIDAYETDPLTGIGPGTFEYWWSREATVPIFARDAHSLYLETLAELGIVGLALIVGLIAWVLGVGTARALAAATERRALLAGAVASAAAFAVAAAVDWVWELAAIPAAFLLIAGAVLAPPVGHARRRRTLATTVVLAALALPALAVIAISLAGAASVRDSQAEARSAQLAPALDRALEAEDVQPYAASASLQQALVLELGGDLDGAAAAAREATREEATNWRIWLTLSRIEAENGNARASVEAYREARSLNPTSPVFEGAQ